MINAIDEYITLNGDDWNYEKHKVIETIPTPNDFYKTIFMYQEYERKQRITEILRKRGFDDKDIGEMLR